MTNARLRNGPANAEAAVSQALQDGDREQRGTASRTNSPAGIFDTITQAAHGFSVGQGVGTISGTWTALTRANYDFRSGVVVAVHSANAFTVCLAGQAQLPGSLSPYTAYALHASTPGLLVPFVHAAEGVGDPPAVFFHTTAGRIWVMGPASNTHGHTLESLTDQADDVHDDTGFGVSYLESYGSTPGAREFKFSLPGLGHNFGPGILTGYLVDSSGAPAAAATWRAQGQLWATSAGGAMQTDAATNPQKNALGFGADYPYSVTPSGQAGPYLWLDPASPGNMVSTRPARGLNTCPVGFWNSGANKRMMFPMLASVLFNRLRDLQDVEDLGAGNPTDGHLLYWDLASLTYKHGAASTAALANDSVTDAKLRDSAALSVIGRSANSIGDPADIVAGTDGHVLRRSGTTLAFGVVANAGLRDSVGVSLMGRSANTTGAVADIVAGADDRVLTRAAGVLAFTTVTTAMMATTGVTASSYGASGASIPTFTVDAAGRLTAAADRTLTPANIGAVDTATFSAHTHNLVGDVGGTTAATVIGAGKVLAAMIGNNQVGFTQLAQSNAYTVIGNGTSALANNSGIQSTADGQVLRRLGTSVAFGADLELGTTGSGAGLFKCYFAASKYVEITSTGIFTVFQTSTSKVEINASSTLTLTYANTNTVTIASADFVGTSKAIKIREIDVCEAGTAKKMLVLCSASY